MFTFKEWKEHNEEVYYETFLDYLKDGTYTVEEYETLSKEEKEELKEEYEEVNKNVVQDYSDYKEKAREVDLEMQSDPVCPYCLEKLKDLHYCFDEGEETVEYECEECYKIFDISYDYHYEWYTIEKPKCEDGKHSWYLDTENWNRKDRYDPTYHLSKYSNYYKCEKCGESKFVPLKDDKTEYSNKYIRKMEKKKKLDNKYKRANLKTKEIKIDKYENGKEIYFRTKKPQGNRQIFNNIIKVLDKKLSFDVSIDPELLYYKTLIGNYRVGVNSDLIKFKLELDNYYIKFEIFKNEEKYSYLDKKRIEKIINCLIAEVKSKTKNVTEEKKEKKEHKFDLEQWEYRKSLKYRKFRLENELHKEIKAENFEKCIILRDILNREFRKEK